MQIGTVIEISENVENGSCKVRGEIKAQRPFISIEILCLIFGNFLEANRDVSLANAEIQLTGCAKRDWTVIVAHMSFCLSVGT